MNNMNGCERMTQPSQKPKYKNEYKTPHYRQSYLLEDNNYQTGYDI